jgi:hypothetical protein
LPERSESLSLGKLRDCGLRDRRDTFPVVHINVDVFFKGAFPTENRFTLFLEMLDRFSA